ncbi:MAG TPA: hypothetical protein VFQ35_11525 [Polyangiaceae bacterium]|nr:hypothetical protein [Polyangiaceae bacterium]
MTELKRWEQDGASDAIARLLQAARTELPSEASLAQSIAAAGAGAVAATATTTAQAALGKLGASTLLGAKAPGLLPALGVLKWLLVGTALGSVVMATLPSTRQDSPSAMAPSSHTARVGFVPVQSSRTLAPVAPEASSSPAIVAPLATVPARAASSEPARTTLERALPLADTRRTGTSRGAAPLIESERLAEEVRAIDDATRALGSGQATRALALLDDYDRRYAERRFAPEALYLRMEALTRLGRSGEARTVAKRLANAYSTSPQAARARALLGETIR